MNAHQAPARRWTPNERAYGVFALTVVLILSLPPYLLPVRIVLGLVWLLAQLPGVTIEGIE